MFIVLYTKYMQKVQGKKNPICTGKSNRLTGWWCLRVTGRGNTVGAARSLSRYYMQMCDSLPLEFDRVGSPEFRINVGIGWHIERTCWEGGQGIAIAGGNERRRYVDLLSLGQGLAG